MTPRIAELDLVEVTRDQEYGLVAGARGVAVASKALCVGAHVVAVAIAGDQCTVEFLDAAGHTVGFFEVSTGDLAKVEFAPTGESVARED